MSGYYSEEHKAEWLPVYQRYEDEIKETWEEAKRATKHLEDQLNSRLRVEHESHRAAADPIMKPFLDKINTLRSEQDAELERISAKFRGDTD